MAVESKVTFCRICEPLCGLIATVDDGRLVALRPDPDHPLSRGQACPKGIAFAEVQNDPDRVLHPLRRTASGEFEQVTWDEALDEIAGRLREIRRRHGGGAIGHYLGNPAAFSFATALWSGLFLRRLGAHHSYTSGSQDINSRFVASKLLYGAASQMPFPDLVRTDLLVMIGANPLVSHGSGFSSPRIKDGLRAITGRGGRVVVVDPRRTETARAHEHVSIRPDADAWFLLALLNVLFSEGLVDLATVRRTTSGLDDLVAACLPHTPESTEPRTGIAPDVVRSLARDLATAPRAVVYGRTGACLGNFATLVNVLIDAVNVVTDNVDVPGGMLFTRAVIPLEDLGERGGAMSYGVRRSRVGGFPDVMGVLPAAVMAEEIERPGDGQLRALFVTSGNPVLTVPDSARLEEALGRLDLLVSLDLYVNETNRHADFVLPATTFLERDDFPFALSGSQPVPFFQMSEAVLAPYGEARQEWTVFADVLDRMGLALTAAGALGVANPLLRVLERRGLRLTPRAMVEALLRLGPYGDRFGLRRGGLNARELRRHPHGTVLAEHAATGIRRDAVRHRGGRIRLFGPEVAAEVARLSRVAPDDPSYPLRLIGLREMRSQNSWMHNSETLMKGGRRHAARISPQDADTHGLVDGGRVRIVSATGAIETNVTVTDEVGPGTVAAPHGWGHRGGWRRANASDGANTNLLASSRPDDLEPLAGMSVLNGVRVRLEAVP